jgi:hypothetical protein
MTTPTLALTLEIRSGDGSRTEFFQNQEESANATLHLLAAPRLFAQPLLMLASRESVSMIPSRTIDMLLAHTLASVPLQWPRGLADIVEVAIGDNAAWQDSVTDNSEAGSNTSPMRIHIYTAGGWAITLEMTPVAQLTVPDQRLLLAHFFDLPVIPFRLAAGGIGFINPSQIIRGTGQPSPDCEHISNWPGLKAVPNTALPVQLLRWIPRTGYPRKSSQNE